MFLCDRTGHLPQWWVVVGRVSVNGVSVGGVHDGIMVLVAMVVMVL